MESVTTKSSVVDVDPESDSMVSCTDGTQDGEQGELTPKPYMSLGEMFPRSEYMSELKLKPNDRSNNFNGSSPDWKMSFSKSPEDVSKYRLENNQLKLQIKQLNMDIQSEQDTISQVRRRLNTVEKERLEATSRANAEITDLESQVARLRSQLEKGEASRQNLEFELTKSRREVNQHRQSTLEKESMLADTKEQLQNRIQDLSEHLRSMEHQLEMHKNNNEENDRGYRRKLEEKDHEISKSHTEQEIIKAERDKLDSLVLQHESAIAEFSEKIQQLENDRKNQTENLRRTLTEIEYAKERENRLKKDLEVSLQRLRNVEENIEAERAAHLETKFNSEIIQLRVRDLEGALEVEKSANDEANKAIDRLTKQIKELESSYETERKNGRDVSTKLEKVEREYSSVRRQLTSEVDNKKNVIGNLSKELEVHQKNFNELKEELTKAKKRQIYLEETYGGSMRELELLLDNFQVDSRASLRSSTGSRKKDSMKVPAPSTVLESLRVTLMEYKKRLDDTTDELGKMKKTSDSLHKEVDQCKEMIWAKDKALEDAQKNYTRTAKELNRIRSEYGELESSMTKLKLNLQSTSNNSNKDRKRIQELSEEIMKLVKRHKADDEEKMAYLHGMYQRLLAGRIVVSTKDPGVQQFTWADLTSLVYEQMCQLVTNVQRSADKIRHLEEALKSREDSSEDMQKSHEDQLNKLTALTKEREISWQKQKEEIESHYTQLLSEVQSRSKKSQAMADQAWEKIRMTGSVQQGLETECLDMRAQLVDVQRQNRALLATCSLLAGALYPTFSRQNLLSLQRKMLEDQMNNWEFCRDRMELLVSTLGSEMKAVEEHRLHEPSKLEKPVKRHPLLTFRIGAVAVLAANRLRYFGQGSSRLFVTYDTGVSNQTGVVVCTGGLKPKEREFPGAMEEDGTETDEREIQMAALKWISSSDLLGTIMSSMSDLLEVMDSIKDKDNASSGENRALVNAARNSFTKLVDKLSRQFEGMSRDPAMGYRDRNSLIRRISRGLTRVCSGKSLEQKRQMAPVNELLGALQNHILDFTQRLHSVEIERRNLVIEMNKLKEECGDIPQREEVMRLQEELTQIRNKELQYVDMDKFESVCQELNNALQREQQAQHLLVEQSKQLEELTLRLDVYTTEGMEKEQTLSDAVHGLTEFKMELKKKEQTLRQLNRQLASSESEKKSLHNNIYDAEKALRTVARDKEILTKYMKAVENGLEQAKKELALAKGFSGQDSTLSKILLSSEFIPSDVGKAGPELIACQNLVGAFVDAQNQAYSKISALENELESYRLHINTLKRELNDAVRREYDDQPEIPTKDVNRSQGNHTIRDLDITSSESFLPIKEDSEMSFVAPKPVTPKSRPYGESPKKTDRSPKFQTPVRHSRSNNIRPKAFEPHGR